MFLHFFFSLFIFFCAAALDRTLGWLEVRSLVVVWRLRGELAFVAAVACVARRAWCRAALRRRSVARLPLELECALFRGTQSGSNGILRLRNWQCNGLVRVGSGRVIWDGRLPSWWSSIVGQRRLGYQWAPHPSLYLMQSRVVVELRQSSVSYRLRKRYVRPNRYCRRGEALADPGSV